MSELFIGLMSGTSVDGVDAVLADFAAWPPRLLGHLHHGFAAELRDELLRLNHQCEDELHRSAVASQHLARAYAAAVQDLLLHAEVEAADVRAIGAHGQTVRHRPEAGYTIQLNAPATLAELTGIDVVADFRSRDVAAGGQGAPLVPAFHAALFATDAPRAVVNIGGISNLTGLPARGADAAVLGFDCGPGNVLIDAWALEHLGEPIDRDGRWAAGGRLDAGLLEVLLAEPFFVAPPPKSTGRELFNPAWLRARLAHRESVDPHNVATTLTRLTAVVIGRALAMHFPQAQDLIVCGGGAHNATLIKMLAEEVAPRPVRSSAELGVAPEHVEALAFAWLAREFLARRPANLPAVTGADGPRVLGCLYPGG
ncbi:MAG TPA: anhydro-N-acetylmuramic acid kinase [Burkholderiaceae bacterium]|nr:anhydro-N-acetylmuramic acid kinase [Burkholderiaceae bacterium]